MNESIQPEKRKDNGKPDFEHLKHGYENSQQCVRFMDTKTGVVIGLATAVFAFVVAALGKLDNGQISSLMSSVFCWPILVLTTLQAISALAIIICCVLSLTAKPPGNGSLKYSALFPYVPVEKRGEAREVYKALAANLSEERKQEEYADQLFIMGQIVSQKITWHRRSILMFGFQLAFAILLLAVTPLALHKCKDTNPSKPSPTGIVVPKSP